MIASVRRTNEDESCRCLSKYVDTRCCNFFKFLQGDPAKATANYLSILPKESCTGLASVWFVFRSLLVLQCLSYGGFIELKAVSKKLATCLSGGALPLVALQCSKPGEHAKCGKRCTLFPFTVHTEKPFFSPVSLFLL